MLSKSASFWVQLIWVILMKPTSIWLEEFENVPCPSLNKDIEVDVLIVGGGLTGLSTAYHLRNKGLVVALCEQNQIGHGVTSKTTGKLTYFQDIYLKILKERGLSCAKLYLESQKEAIEIVKKIIEEHHIACDFERNTSCLYVHNHQELLQETKEVFEKMNVSFSQKGDSILYVEDCYVFHPLKYLGGLKNVILESHLQIYENTRITSIKKATNGYLCEANGYRIFSKKIIVASHYPFFLVPFWMPFKTYLEKSTIVAYPVLQNEKWNSISLDKTIISKRFFENYAFYLSDVHPTCQVKESKEAISLDASYVWSNKDVMTYDGLPFMGALNSSKTLLLATGYNTWGMTNGSLSGKILTSIVLYGHHRYESLFDPLRYMTLTHLPSLMKIAGGNMKGFVLSKLHQESSLRYEKREGRKVAIYTDENKKEHIVYPICPHLYCSLIFNELEKTWDCPCHGSRFDIDGYVIEGPSQYNISYKKKREA